MPSMCKPAPRLPRLTCGIVIGSPAPPASIRGPPRFPRRRSRQRRQLGLERLNHASRRLPQQPQLSRELHAQLHVIAVVICLGWWTSRIGSVEKWCVGGGGGVVCRTVCRRAPLGLSAGWAGVEVESAVVECLAHGIGECS